MTTKRILILKGSPRPRGNSTLLANRVAEGATAAGATVESFLLRDMTIQPCDGCDACQNTGDSECIIGDDMQTLYPRLRQADVIVIASPIYWFMVNAQTKLCIDRWYALETPHGSALKGKKFAAVLTYGDTDPYTSGAVNAMHMFQDMCRYLKAELVGMVYGKASDQGDIEKQPALMDKAYELGKKLASAT